MLLRHLRWVGAALLALAISPHQLIGADDDGADPAPAAIAPAAAGPVSPTAPAVSPLPFAPVGPTATTSVKGEAAVPERFTRWLHEVDPLITQPEREAFLSLRRDYHRDAFIRRFWQVRDPFPETGRNELKENWDERVF